MEHRSLEETPHTNTPPNYRPDIDGLRALAILSVLGFHLSPTRVPGGFVGVDVFFVISGYLISTIILSQVAASRFSIIDFYERRIRRIFPALFGMLIALSVAMSFVLLPTEFVSYAKSLFAATFSASNFYFWRHSSYFDSPTSYPLLHTWSLAVEEQFYIAFPLFLIAVRRICANRLRQGVLLLLIILFLVSTLVVHYSATTAFYMPYTRSWELLIGTALTLKPLPDSQGNTTRNILSILGLLLIVLAVFCYNPQTLFPGLAAAIPCVGSALIIASGHSRATFIGRILSWRPLVFIGLISYSLYLWHWPVIVLNNLGVTLNLDSVLPSRWGFLALSQTISKTIQILASFLLAILSWRFIERPFRSRPQHIARAPLFALSAVTMLFIFICSGLVVYENGFPNRFPPRAVEVASFLTPPGASTLGELDGCTITNKNEAAVFSDAQCLRGDPEKSYLLVGDSHAGSLWNGLKSSMPETNIVFAGVWGCRPSVHPKGSALCARMMRFIFDRYLPSHNIRGLLIEARWYSKDMDEIRDIVKWAQARNVKVVVFGPVAEYDSPLPRLLAYSIAWDRPQLAQRHLIAYSPMMDAEMQNLARDTWHVPYVSLYEATCEHGRCIEYANKEKDIPLLNDTDHLSEAGAGYLVERLVSEGRMSWVNEEPSQRIGPRTTDGS